MSILVKLRELLETSGVPYEIVNHPLAYTAQEVAATQHVPGKEIAKVVMLDVNGEIVMAVIRGDQKIALDTARISLNRDHVQLATETEFTTCFPGCEIGAMPPFGNLFGLSVVVDPALAKDEFIYFNAGNHVQTLRLRYQDFLALVKPQVRHLVDAPKRKAA